VSWPIHCNGWTGPAQWWGAPPLSVSEKDACSKQQSETVCQFETRFLLRTCYRLLEQLSLERKGLIYMPGVRTRWYQSTKTAKNGYVKCPGSPIVMAGRNWPSGGAPRHFQLVRKMHVVSSSQRQSVSLRQDFFSERIIDCWNSLEQCVIDSATVNAFKNGLRQTQNIKTGFFMD